MSKYEFWFSFNNNEERLQLPVNPGEISISNRSNNETVSVSKIGEVSIIQEPTLKTFSFSSFFPAEYGPYCSYRRVPNPWSAVKDIERWKDSGKPVRFIITGTPVNFAVTIESFDYDEVGGDVGTINFSIMLREYRFVKPRQLVEQIVFNEPAVLAVTDSRPDTKPPVKSYTVKPGDSLWKIAQKNLGNGARYPEIASLNGIKAPYTIYPNQELKLP